MRNLLKLFALAAIAVSCFALTSCPEIDAAHNHVYSKDWSYDEDSHWRDPICAHKDELNAVNLGGHVWDEGARTAEPTEFEEGKFTYTCTTCGMERHEPIEKLPHTHTYSEEWAYNDYYHWHNASCEHTSITGPKENHAYLNNTCIICGFMKESEGLEYALLPEGTYAVMGRGTCNDKNLVIPKIKDGKKVTAIADGAFGGHEILSKLILPDSITSIGNNAFLGCKNLVEIVYEGDSLLKSIGDNAFSNCWRLTEVEIPRTVTHIGSSVFYYCNNLTAINVDERNTTYKSVDGVLYSYDGTALLQYPIAKTDTEYIIGADVKTIGACAFASCDFLEKIVFEEGCAITSIPYQAFYYLTALTEIVLPDTVTEIGKEAIAYCTSLEEFTIPAGVTVISEALFSHCYMLKEINLPDGVTSIGKEAFSNCRAIKTLTVPQKVKQIGASFLIQCLSLETVTIPASVTSIGSEPLRGSSMLVSVTVDEANTRYKSIDGNLYNKSGNTLIHYSAGKTDTEFTLPSTVTKIGDFAFFEEGDLVKITLCEGLTSIGKSAFYSMSNLETVVFPSTLKTIGANAFELCASLKTADLPESVTRISDFAFFNCDALESVTIQSTVTSIGLSAFAFCEKLTSITFEDTEGWQVSINTTTFDIAPEELADTATAAHHLVLAEGYQGYYWTKK